MQEFNRDRPKDLIGIDIPDDILEIRMPGKVFFRVKCDCPCHDPDKVMMHCFPCCDNGWMWREETWTVLEPLPVNPKEVLDQFGLDRKSGNTLWNGPTIFDFRIEEKYIIRDKHGNIRIWKSK